MKSSSTSQKSEGGTVAIAIMSLVQVKRANPGGQKALRKKTVNPAMVKGLVVIYRGVNSV